MQWEALKKEGDGGSGIGRGKLADARQDWSQEELPRGLGGLTGQCQILLIMLR